ncbi:Acetyl-coenzyme A synthetase, cytoplasmic isoform X2 [Oopsacas minuta]|uniref:Acetyl-coenzyme A synthetase n=1 Tax=Oopsacas minuta TaxID=111878 RepID=A0AAV7KJT3_9METZ|nr:Acetyl-coenzyme A synthetase, cytoplasmic isoform X2 [Oopsacas minuta]
MEQRSAESAPYIIPNKILPYISVMASHITGEVYPPSSEVAQESHVRTMEEYKHMYKRSIEDPEHFWSEIAEQFYWKHKWEEGSVLKYNFDVGKGGISIEWFKGAVTNICYNCLDRHVKDGRGDVVAFYWEGNDPADKSQYTYQQLLNEVCKFSNCLKKLGVKKGDRVGIYLPMIVELVIAMLACARIGAIHSIVFAGFSANSLSDRIMDSKCDLIITADGMHRGSKFIKLEEIADEALLLCETKGFLPKSCILFRNMRNKKSEKHPTPGYKPKTAVSKAVSWLDWTDLMSVSADWCEAEWVDAEMELFMLYTSGSTGKPKGVVHTHGGYMLYASTTFKYVFDYHAPEVFFCTADIGWITGHSYITYGPLATGATSVIFEGVPTYPDAGRLWQLVDTYKVSKFYTAPTAIRLLMKFGDDLVKKYSRKSLKILGTVGEPINPETWIWYYTVVGDKRCSIVDTWWQTETGGHMITPLPGCTPQKPGSATFPFFGIVPAIFNEDGNEIEGEGQGYLVIKKPWPSTMRTVYGDHSRFESTYFEKFPGYYLTGDGCYRDKEGYYWLTGRTDDILNVSGHRLGTAELESALVQHSDIVEAAVVSGIHEIKGESIYCFVTTRQVSYIARIKCDIK